MTDTGRHDNDHTPVLLGTSSTDGVSPVVIWADPVTHRLLVSGTGGGGNTFFADTVSGTINSSNVTFTVPNSITAALVLFLAGIPYQPTVDFTTSGTTITMTTAPDTSLSGQPFWLLHV